jgi:hypothetical protein
MFTRPPKGGDVKLLVYQENVMADALTTVAPGAGETFVTVARAAGTAATARTIALPATARRLMLEV